MRAIVRDRYGACHTVYDARYTDRLSFIHDLMEHGYTVIEVG